MYNFVPCQGEDFQSVVQVMREFLPQAEAELKFKALPDDEMAIIQLIEKHEVSHFHHTISFIVKYNGYIRELSGSVVECLTQDLGAVAVGSSLTGITALCP